MADPTDRECDGCGSTLAERERRSKANGGLTGLRKCPHCGADKCLMCDMGDDVECGNCPDEGASNG